jgi:hypothetical protein
MMPSAASREERRLEEVRFDILTCSVAANIRRHQSPGRVTRHMRRLLDTGTLTERQAVENINDAWQFAEPKSGRSRRTLPRPPQAIAAFREQKA